MDPVKLQQVCPRGHIVDPLVEFGASTWTRDLSFTSRVDTQCADVKFKLNNRNAHIRTHIDFNKTRTRVDLWGCSYIVLYQLRIAITAFPDRIRDVSTCPTTH